MTFRVTNTTVLFSEGKYREAANEIKKAAVGGNFALAARTLGVNYRTMTRWLNTLKAQAIDVRDELAVTTSRTQTSKLFGKTAGQQKEIILDTVRRTGGSITTAADILGVSSQRLYKVIGNLELANEIERIRVNPVPSRRARRSRAVA